MADYHYQGRRLNDGMAVSGSLSAGSQAAVVRQLQQQNIIATEVSLLTMRSSKSLRRVVRRRWPSPQSAVSLNERILFCRQMYALSRSGIPLMRAVNGLADSSASPELQHILLDIGNSLAQGISLANAFASHRAVFGELFIAMMHMGESTGRLDMAFRQLVEHLELEKNTRNRIAAAIRYPLILISTILLALIIVTVNVIPEFSSLFHRLGAELPLPTQVLISTSDFILSYWPLLIILPVLAAITLHYGFRTPVGRLYRDRQLLRLPLLGRLYERVALARFARPLAMMLQAGVPLPQALNIASRTTGNEHTRLGINAMLQGVERGETLLHTASASGLFNGLMLQMIAVGEESGNVSELLADMADFYDQEVEFDLQRLSEAVTPILLFIMAVLVLVLALGVFLPMWELGSAFGLDTQ